MRPYCMLKTYYLILNGFIFNMTGRACAVIYNWTKKIINLNSCEFSISTYIVKLEMTILMIAIVDWMRWILNWLELGVSVIQIQWGKRENMLEMDFLNSP